MNDLLLNYKIDNFTFNPNSVLCHLFPLYFVAHVVHSTCVCLHQEPLISIIFGAAVIQEESLMLTEKIKN